MLHTISASAHTFIYSTSALRMSRRSTEAPSTCQSGRTQSAKRFLCCERFKDGKEPSTGTQRFRPSEAACGAPKGVWAEDQRGQVRGSQRFQPLVQDSAGGGVSAEAAEANAAVVDEVLHCKAAAKRCGESGTRGNHQRKQEHNDGGLQDRAQTVIFTGPCMQYTDF
jgi:hypothetical protein